MKRFAEIDQIKTGVVFSDPYYDESVWCQYRTPLEAKDWLMSQEVTYSDDGWYGFEVKIGRPTMMNFVTVKATEASELVFSMPSFYSAKQHELGMDTACIFCGTAENFNAFGESAAIHTGSDGFLADLFVIYAAGTEQPVGFVLEGVLDSSWTNESSLFEHLTSGFGGKEISLQQYNALTSPTNSTYCKMWNEEFQAAKKLNMSQYMKNQSDDIER